MKARILCMVLVVTLVSFMLPIGNAVVIAAGDSVVTFADPNLEAVVREAIKKPIGDIFESDVAGITQLVAIEKDITNLTGIEKLVNLTSLNLYSNKISEISALAGLSSLKGLNLAFNKIRDISALAGLSNLKELSLNSNEISNIDSLAGLRSLTWLIMDSNEIRDISALAGLSSLTRIDLYSNKIRDISALAGLSNLNVLSLDSNEIRDISALAGLSNLTSLSLRSNEISDINMLSGLDKLNYLYLDSNKIRDISALAGLSNLTSLSLASNEISDISMLSGLDKLNYLSLYSNEISDISMLSGLDKLNYLYLAKNYLDITQGSDDMSIIQAFIDKGVKVEHQPQNPIDSIPVPLPSLPYDRINSTSSSEEVMGILNQTYTSMTDEQKQDSEVKEQVAEFTEYAIEKLGTFDTTMTNNTAEVKADLIKDGVQQAKEAKKDVEAALTQNGIEKNRDLMTSIKLEAKGGDSTSFVVNKDVVQVSEGINNIKLSTGKVEVSIDPAKLEKEIGNGKNLTVSVVRKSGVNARKPGSFLVASIGGGIPFTYDELMLAYATDSESYEITFTDDDGNSLDSNVGVALPVSSGDPEYNCVFVNDNGMTEAIGGRYNQGSKLIEVETRQSGTYYVKENKKSFGDIAGKDEMTRKAIEVIAAKGIIEGRGEGKFDPDASISRSEFSKLIVRALYMTDYTAEAGFIDVPSTAWYKPYVASAKKAGLINGYEDNTFRGGNVINKQEIIKISSAVLNTKKGYYYPQNEDKYLNFTDKAQMAAWVRKYAALAAREGIVIKREDGRFIGTQPSTRADAAVMLYRLFNKL